MNIGFKGLTEPVTCSIAELEFVRVLTQAPQYGFTVAHARIFLLLPEDRKHIHRINLRFGSP